MATNYGIGVRYKKDRSGRRLIGWQLLLGVVSIVAILGAVSIVAIVVWTAY